MGVDGDLEHLSQLLMLSGLLMEEDVIGWRPQQLLMCPVPAPLLLLCNLNAKANEKILSTLGSLTAAS